MRHNTERQCACNRAQEGLRGTAQSVSPRGLRSLTRGFLSSTMHMLHSQSAPWRVRTTIVFTS